jgi:hypothetical protein
LVEHVGEETVVYDLQSKEAHCLSAVAALVFREADGSKSLAEVAELARTELGPQITDQQISEAVDQLDMVSLLEQPLVTLHSSNGNGEHEKSGVSRREMMRRVGFAGAAAAVATSMITSVVPPTAAAAGSGIPPGCTGCGGNPDCQSNHCCQSNAGKQCEQNCCVGKDNSCHTNNVCVGGANNGNSCTTDANCPGGTCGLQCTVCASSLPGDQCPTTCPPGSSVCCTPNC